MRVQQAILPIGPVAPALTPPALLHRIVPFARLDVQNPAPLWQDHGAWTAMRSRAARAAPRLGRESSPPWRCAMSRSEEHTSELQSLMRISYAVFCFNNKKQRMLSSSRTTT